MTSGLLSKEILETRQGRGRDSAEGLASPHKVRRTTALRPLSGNSQVRKNRPRSDKKRAGGDCTPQINISPKSGVICPFCI
jgi:hypothetical protein